MMEELLNSKVHSNERFIKSINHLTNRGISVMDAIIHYAETFDLELETVATMVEANAKLKANLQQDAEELNYLPKTSRLPF